MTRLLGGLLLAVGILIMTGSGICSLAVIVMGMSGGSGGMMGLYVLIIGGIPFLAGFGLFRLGRWILKPVPPSPDEQAAPFE